MNITMLDVGQQQREPTAATPCVVPSIEKSQAMWASKNELYLATGSYCSWRLDVNLSPPAAFVGPPPAMDATFLQYHYNVLQYILYETGFPETVDETKEIVKRSKRMANNGTESAGEIEEGLDYQRDNSDNVTIAVLSNPIEVIGMLVEGGRQSPGDMLLVLSMSWVEKRRIMPTSSTRGPSMYRLYVHKAIAFMDSGRSALREFTPPRRATYCVNFFLASCTGAMRNDGHDLETDLDCMLTSRQLCQLVDDKLFMRMLIAERCRSTAIQVPRTLAFVYQAIRSYDLLRSGTGSSASETSQHASSTNGNSDNNTDSQVNVIHLPPSGDVTDLMTSSIAAFVNSSQMQPCEKVVVKPSGDMWMSSMGVTIHNRTDLDSITSAAKRLLVELQPGDAILVEAFGKTFQPRHSRRGAAATNGCESHVNGHRYETGNGFMTSQSLTSQLSFSATDVNSCRFRATVCRGPDNKAHMSKLFCSIGYCNEPLHSDNTVGQSLDTTLVAFGVTDPDVRVRTYETLKSAAESVMATIIEYEKGLSNEERGSPHAQTDLIGIDFILTDDTATSRGKNGQCNGKDELSHSADNFLPFMIEVNSWNCTTECDIYEYLSRETSGEALEMFVGNMVAASQRTLAAGVTLLVWGASSEVVMSLAHRYRIHVIHIIEGTDIGKVSTDDCRYQELDVFYSQLMCYSGRSSFATDCVTLQHNAEQLVRYLQQKLPPPRTTADINGVLSFDRHLVPLSSTVASLLGLPIDHVTSPSGASTALDVGIAQRILVTCNATIPHFNASCMYSLLYGLDSSDKLRHSSPCVLAARDWIDKEDDRRTCMRDSGAGDVTSYSSSSLKSLVEAVRQVHRVDIVVQRRKLLGGIVSDYVITKSLLSLNGQHIRLNDESSSTTEGDTEQRVYYSPDERRPAAAVNIRWPTALPNDKRDQLVIAAYQCCNELNLVTGVFTVEMTFDVVSPKMIRVIPCLDLTGDGNDPDERSVKVDFYDRLLANSGVDLILYALLMAGRHGRPQPALPVHWSYQKHLGCRKMNYGPPIQPFEVNRMRELIENGC